MCIRDSSLAGGRLGREFGGGLAPVLGRQGGHRVEERSRLRGRASGHPKVVGDPDIADEHAVGEQRLPGAASVGQPTEQDEVGIAGHGREALCCKGFHDAVALGLNGCLLYTSRCV